MAAVIGALRAELSASVAKFESDLGRAGRRITTLEKKFGRLAGVANKAQVAFAGIGPALIGSLTGALVTRGIRQAVAAVASLADEASRAGTSIENMQALIFATRQEGGDQGKLVDSLQKFNYEIGLALEGSGDLEQRLGALGIPLRGVNGQVRETKELFLDVAEAVKQAGSQQDQALLAQKTLGRGAADLIPFLKLGRQEIERLMGVARETGNVLDKELVLKAKKLDDAWTAATDTLGVKLKGAIVDVVTHLDDMTESGDAVNTMTKFLSDEVDALARGLKGTADELRAIINFFDKLTTLSPPAAEALSAEGLRSQIAAWEKLLQQAEARGEHAAAANMRARIKELRAQIVGAKSDIGPAFEQLGRHGAAAFADGFAKAGVRCRGEIS